MSPRSPLDAENYPHTVQRTCNTQATDDSPVERAVIASVEHDVQPLNRISPSLGVLLGQLPGRQGALYLGHLRH